MSVRLLDHWSPPDRAGAPVACLATTFTFEADFFVEDCLSRFLSLSTVASETSGISSIAAVLEEEDRLNETQVTVLVDRSSPAEKRNLRWDLVPVAVPGGLLHAKTAVLLWERTARIVIGSANLTSAGYRRQVELALAIDVDESCDVPRAVLDAYVSELRHLVDLAPGSGTSGPKQRANSTVDALERRIASLDLSTAQTRDLRIAIAPARPGVTPLDHLDDVWRGPQPLHATVLSPFWDDATPTSALEAIRHRLTGRPASQRSLRVVAAIDPFNGVVQAPASLASQHDLDLVAFEPPDTEQRGLHAKLLLMESTEWLAAMIGSSNATQAGYGLANTHGHHELNVWLGCPSTSRTAKALRALARPGERIDVDDEQWQPPPDEDEPVVPALPLGFSTSTLLGASPPRLALELSPARLPESWDVRTPAGTEVLEASTWRANGSPARIVVPLTDDALPAYLDVRWTDAGARYQATWTVNVEDRSTLPPPAELRELPVEVLLSALASARPLPVALEHELRRREQRGGDGGDVELDPLRRFDDSGLLLQRTRHVSLALWRLQERLGRPATSIDALHWRLRGPFGPVAIADGLVAAAREDQTLPGEAQFLLAELALTVAAVDWDHVVARVVLDRSGIERLVDEVLRELEERHRGLPPAPDSGLDGYVRDAFAEAQR